MREPLLFRGLDPAVVDGVLAQARRRTFRRGDIVFHEGDPGDSLQVIVRGHFALRLVTPRGDMCFVRVFGPGDLFGRVALGPIEAVRQATVVSLEEGESFELFHSQLDELRRAHPCVNDALIVNTGLELRRATERLLEALFVDADRRVRRRLLELGEEYRDGDSGTAVVPLTQEDLAAYAGTSRATVSRVLAEEERRGTIAKRRRSIAVLDAARLASLARWPGADAPASPGGLSRT